MTDELDPTTFCRGFVSRLVLDGRSVIQPKSVAGRRGFRQLVQVLNQEIANRRERGESGDMLQYRQLVRLRNYLQEGNNGAFENLETLLRDMQTSALMLPNPDYEEMTIVISRPYAESILGEFGSDTRQLIESAAMAFSKEQKEASLPNF